MTGTESRNSNTKSCSFSITHISRVSDYNGVSRLYNMLETFHSDPEPSISSS